MNRLLMTLLAVAVPVSFVAALPAGEPAPAGRSAAKPAPEKLSAAEVQKLLKQLASGKYKERNHAMQKLMAADPSVIAPVARAADTADIELGARCVDVLKHFYKKGDAAGRTAAQAALKKLQHSKHPAVAKWAAEVVRPSVPNLPRGLPFGGGIRIQIGAIGGAGGMHITSRSVNGRREMQITENGGRKITISDRNGKNIAMTVTQTVNGKQKTTRYAAKDLDELKKKHPEAARIYERYGKRGPRVGVAGGGFFGGLQPLPPGGGGPIQVLPLPQGFPAPLRRTPGNRQLQRARARLAAAQVRLANAVEKLQGLAKQTTIDRDAIRRATDDLRKAQAELKQAAGDLK